MLILITVLSSVLLVIVVIVLLQLYKLQNTISNNELVALLDNKVVDIQSVILDKLEPRLVRLESEIKLENANRLNIFSTNLSREFYKFSEQVAQRESEANQNILLKFSQLNADIISQLHQFKAQIISLENDAAVALHKNINQLIIEQTNNFGIFKESIIEQSASSNNLMISKLNTFGQELNQSLTDNVAKLVTTLRDELDKLNQKVEDKLKTGFEDTNKTFYGVLERLAKIDEAQKNIEKLSTQVVSLQDVLTDKKSRGIFGEIQLNHVLSTVFGENAGLHKLYDIQHKLSSGAISDAVVFAPQPLGLVCIDSKFPLENYRRMIDKDLSVEERKTAHKDFETNVKKHINDIKDKYIITNETSDQVMMFIPAEAIFAHINAYHYKLVEYAQQNRVWLVSPTTLIAQLSTLQILIRNSEQQKYAKVIQENLLGLSTEFGRYKDRWDKLSKHIDTVSKDVKDIHITTDSIGQKFDRIAQVDLLQINENS